MSRENAGSDLPQGLILQASRQVPPASANVTTARAIPAAQQPMLSKEQETAQQPQTIPGVMDAWMGPLNPLAPSAPSNVRGRALDLMVGWNITTPSQRPGQPSYQELRALARNCGLVSMAIQKRKDQLEQGHFDFRLKGDRTGFKSVKDSRIQELRDFFAFPDRRRPHARWLRKWMDDALVLDAPCLWVERNRAGKPYSIRVIDTATIKPLLDADGETPLPPSPAFQQWLKGVPAADYAAAGGPDAVFGADAMLWHPRNPRPDTVYGYSPVEQIFIEVNLSIRRTLLILAGYTEGSVPEALVPTPENWNLDQIVEFQAYWDAMVSGQYGVQRGLRFVPAGLEKATFTKKWDDHNDYDEWLARFVFTAFGLPPTGMVKQMNRATAEQAQDTADDEGLMPWLNYVAEVHNILIWKYWGYTDIECVFRPKNASDELQGAQAAAARVAAGLTTRNEERADVGRDPYGPDGDVPTITTGSGPVAIKPPEPQPVPEALLGQAGDPTKPKGKAGDDQTGREDDPAKKGDAVDQLAEKLADALLRKGAAKKKGLMY